jgi:hypothetical protein
VLRCLQDVTGRLQTSANRVLTAVDWPPPAAQQPPGNGAAAQAATNDGHGAGTDAAQGDERPADCLESGAMAHAHSADSGGIEAEQWLARWARQLSMFRFAMQDWTERLWQVRCCW